MNGPHILPAIFKHWILVSLCTIQQWRTGKKDVVTGARSGNGFEMALELASEGTATVHHIQVCNSDF